MSLHQGLALFPCESVNIVEYTLFARAIDNRIKTEKIVWRPGEFNGNYYCVWKFYIP
jgi:hypothetical protein